MVCAGGPVNGITLRVVNASYRRRVNVKYFPNRQCDRAVEVVIPWENGNSVLSFNENAGEGARANEWRSTAGLDPRP